MFKIISLIFLIGLQDLDFTGRTFCFISLNIIFDIFFLNDSSFCKSCFSNSSFSLRNVNFSYYRGICIDLYRETFNFCSIIF